MRIMYCPLCRANQTFLRIMGTLVFKCPCCDYTRKLRLDGSQR